MSGERLRVALVTPTYFGSESFVGGGERFVEELARALAGLADVKLISFGSSRFRSRQAPSLERVVLRNWTRDKMTPLSPHLARELRGFDVVHAFQYYTLSTFLAVWIGHRLGSRVFVTDLGGGGWTPGYQVDQSRWIDGHLPISRYAAGRLPGRRLPSAVLHGGVDADKYAMRRQLEHDGSVVFLGRILPHKGVHFLLDGLPPGTALDLIGPVGSPEYLESLKARATGKKVRFHHDLDDAAVIARLQRAMVLVHPTPVDERGEAGAAELFGLALLEAMACGCPVIASRAASLPEIVEEGVCGRLVEPNRPAEISAAIASLASDGEAWQRMACAARRRASSVFSWQRSAEVALAFYRQAGAGSDGSRDHGVPP